MSKADTDIAIATRTEMATAVSQSFLISTLCLSMASLLLTFSVAFAISISI